MSCKHYPDWREMASSSGSCLLVFRGTINQFWVSNRNYRICFFYRSWQLQSHSTTAVYPNLRTWALLHSSTGGHCSLQAAIKIMWKLGSTRQYFYKKSNLFSNIRLSHFFFQIMIINYHFTGPCCCSQPQSLLTRVYKCLKCNNSLVTKLH